MSGSLSLTIWDWNNLNADQQHDILQRPGILANLQLSKDVADIIQNVRTGGDQQVLELTNKLDKVQLASLEIPSTEWELAEQTLSSELLKAIYNAADRIRHFHTQAIPKPFTLETAPGVICETQYRPIRRVGLYVPAGSAPLPSTMLMLGIPASLAGCTELIVCSPPNKQGLCDPAVLAAAHLCGVHKVFAIGGAQAIAAMAYGTESVPKCDKLFGPGNRWVTEAKQQVSINAAGAAIDMPAGPSEVMVIADDSARAEWVAADLLSQAEHGPDSQVILVTTSSHLLLEVQQALHTQLQQLPRQGTAQAALQNSMAIVVNNNRQAIEVSNSYAPEHLILATNDARDLVSSVQAAGSVFVGHYTPESLGDYCSGTNHVLPTAGWARNHGSLSSQDFMNRMTVQEATVDGLRAIGSDAITLAKHEQLDAHAMAVRLRMEQN